MTFPFDDPESVDDPPMPPPTLTVDFVPSEPWVLELPDGTERLIWAPFGFGLR